MTSERQANNFSKQLQGLYRSIDELRRRVDYIEPRQSISGGYSEKSWAFKSPSGSTGTFYYGGYYIFGASHNDFSPAINFGTANAAYGAHFFVVLGGVTIDELTIRVTGTSIADEAIRTAGDTEDIVIPSGTAINSYFETAIKWIGQINISVVGGTAQNCNYGFDKYWDNNNKGFTVIGFEATWLGGANDSSPNIKVLHHKATGWTYNAGSTPTPPTQIADMQTDYVTEYQVINGVEGAYKRTNLDVSIAGAADEGTIIEVITTSNKAFDLGTLMLRIRA